jgi:hypothetical protein
MQFLIKYLANNLAFAGTRFFGAIFSKLTRPAVTQPDGQTQYFDNSALATQALAAGSAKTTQPGTSDLSNLRIGGSGPIGGPGDDGSTTGSVTDFSPVAAPQPKMGQPTFAQASGGGTTPLSNELTSKGKVLSLLLTAGQGAARGAAASVPTNPHISPGLGPSIEAGFETIPALKQQQNTLAMQQLEQQKEKAQIASLPLQAAMQRQLMGSEIDRNEAMADTRGNFTSRPGDLRFDAHGNLLGRGADVGDVAKSKQAGKEAGTVAAVQNAGGTPAQVLSALGVKNPTDKNTTTAQMYLDSNDGDPAAAIKAMNADRVSTSNSIHANIARLRSIDGGDSPAVSRMVKSDPQYSGYQKQRDALVSRLATEQANSFSDPKVVSSLQTQTDALTQKMIARRAALGGGTTPSAAPPKTQKGLDAATAQQYLQKAGGDKNKARQLAAADGYSF